ncbi:MAG: GNAT family N-acetyltransferase [Coriobacteriales bacterium]|nr:GNAT family N-acetyltransferase [Coriobacteriales bacterium]
MDNSTNVDFVLVEDPESIAILANLAQEIWMEHFPVLIGNSTAEYLYERMLSIDALITNIGNENYQYYFTRVNDENIGFIGVQPQENTLFLSKLYLKKDFRGKGYGRQQLEFVKEIARHFGFKSIKLTCNRGNTSSIDMYKHVGFKITDEVDTDVGEGYYMNDYVMVWDFDE